MFRIGLLGGTFDPPHLGHLALAKHFIERLNLNKFIWIPTGHSWQKEKTSIASHRMAMTKILSKELIVTEPKLIVEVSDIEIARAGPSYTLDTLNLLQERCAVQDFPTISLYWLMGLDQLLQLHTWHNWRDIFSYVNVCVAGRFGYKFSQVSPDVQVFCEKQALYAQSATYGGFLFDSQLNINLSSTSLRSLLRKFFHQDSLKCLHQKQINTWLTPSLLAYIKQYKLYEFKG